MEWKSDYSWELQFGCVQSRCCVLQCVLVCCRFLQRVTYSCSVLQSWGLQCGCVQYGVVCNHVAVCCSVLQRVAVCYRADMQRGHVWPPHRSAHCFAACCTVLQRVADNVMSSLSNTQSFGRSIFVKVSSIAIFISECGSELSFENFS